MDRLSDKDYNSQGQGFDPSLRNPKHFESKPRITDRLRGAMLAKNVLTLEYPPGTDTSRWNTFTSGALYRAGGYLFMVIKATEGTSIVDSKFTDSWHKCLDNDIIPMTYHFFRSHLPGTDQADFHLNTIAPLIAAASGKILPPAWDVETNDGGTLTERQNRCLAGLQYLEANFKKPFVYSSRYTWAQVIGTVSWIANYWQWVASWTSAPTPTLPVNWTTTRTKMWQVGISGQHSWIPRPVPGITGTVDYNRWMGTQSELRVMAGRIEPTVEERLAKLEAGARAAGWPGF